MVQSTTQPLFNRPPATLHKLNPQVRIDAASGLAATAEAATAGVDLFLPKPYTAEKLLKAIARVLR